MQDVEIIGMLKSYVKASLVGMGALKGAACQIQSIVDGTDEHTITFKWEDNNGTSHTSTLVVKDGTDGTNGVGITDISKTSTAGLVDTYTITLSDGSTYDFTVTNGSGGGGGASNLSDLDDVSIASLADGNTLVYDSTTSKWVNSTLLATMKTKLDTIEENAEVNAIDEVKLNGTALTPDANKAVNIEAVESVKVNGVSQTVTSGAVDLDVASNLITETQWTSINNLYA